MREYGLTFLFFKTRMINRKIIVLFHIFQGG